MSELALFGSAFIFGLLGLIWSADRFIDGSVAIARHLRLSPLFIGVTVVSLGTSAPEILVSVQATMDGAGDLAVGNAIGSNIANIGLVLGATALLTKLPMPAGVLRCEIPLLIFVTLLSGALLWDGHLGRAESLLMAALTIPVLVFLLQVKRSSRVTEPPNSSKLTFGKALFWFLAGILILIISSRILVWGAIGSATHFGISPLMVGLTVVALGTSLPELAASIASAWRGHAEIALGNVIGSNIFNLLVVMPIPGMLHPLTMEPEVFTRDYLAMAALTLLMFIIITHSQRRPSGASLG